MWIAKPQEEPQCIERECTNPATHMVLLEEVRYDSLPGTLRCQQHAESRAVHLNQRDRVLMEASKRDN